MEAFVALAVSIVSGVIVSLVSLWLAGRQRDRQERQKESVRRQAILASIGRELQWNRSAIRSEVDAGDAHVMIGRLATVAFERHGSELAMIAPDSVASVFEHYPTVGMTREGIHILAGRPDRKADEDLRLQWIRLSEQARVDVSNSATQALSSLGIPLKLEDGVDASDPLA